MANLKDWKDGEKLTGIDYTYERETITDKATQLDEEATRKDADVFVLSRYEPQDVYVDTVWMNPNQFNLDRHLEGMVTTNVSATGFMTFLNEIDISATITTQASASGYKIDFVGFTNVDYVVDTDLTTSGYKVQRDLQDIDYVVNTDLTTTAYKQQLLDVDITYDVTTSVAIGAAYKNKRADEDIEFLIQTILTTSGYKQQLVRDDITYTTNLALTTSGYKEQRAVDNIDYTINTTLTTSGVKHKEEDAIISHTIQTSASATGYKPTKTAYISTGVTTTVTTSGNKNQREESNIDYTVTTTVSLNGNKNQTEELDVDYTISTNISVNGYKLQEQESNVDYTISTSVSTNGYKSELKDTNIDSSDITTTVTTSGFASFIAYARSDITFTDTFILDGIYREVTLANDYRVLETLAKNSQITFDGPEEITENSVTYRLQNVTFQIDGGGTNTISSSQLPYSITVTGPVYISFNYEEIQFIEVESRAISDPSTQFGPVDIRFRTYDGSTQIAQSTQSVEQQYTASHQFEDRQGYELEITLLDPEYSLNNEQYVWKAIRVYDDINNLVTTWGNTGSTTPTLLFEPNAFPTFTSTMSVEVEYEILQTYTIKGALNYSGSTSLPVTTSYDNGDPSDSDFFSKFGPTTVSTKLEGTRFTMSFNNEFNGYEFSQIRVGPNRVDTLSNTTVYPTPNVVEFTALVEEFASIATPNTETIFVIYFT